jgi:anti-sigma factor RsiW
MSDETHHELLSAYLDGELQADERQRAEQLLAESAECRQVYEELCALRASLASLPRHKLDEDLGERVLRIAQESKLGKGKEAAAARKEEDEAIEPAAGDSATAGGMSAAERNSRRWRTILYPVLAVAAAVAMMLNSEKQEKQKDKRDRHESQIAHAPMKQDAQASISAPPDELGDEESALTIDESLDKAKAATPFFSARVNEDSMRDEAPGESAARSPEDAENAFSAGSGPASKRGAMGGGMPAAEAKLNIAGGDRKAAMGSPPATLVITCKLAPTAIQNKAFESLLARNHLVPWSAPERLARKPKSRAAGPSPADSGDSVQRPDNQADSFKRLDKKVDSTEKLAENELKPDHEHAWSKSVVVELDARQLVAVLADLQNHPEQFLSVELPGQQDNDRRQALSSEKVPAAAPSVVGQQVQSKAEPVFEAEQVAKDQAGKAGANAADADADAADSTETAGGSRPQRLRVLFRLSAATGN